jgi:hypothetical protein
MTHRVTKAQQAGLDMFFDYAKKRHQCYLMKIAEPSWKTADPILAKYRFTNVFRELDRVTVWLRENVRDPMNKRRDPRLMLAVFVFRMFNRTEVGEAIFRDDDLLGVHAAFDRFAEKGDVRHLKKAILNRLGNRGPYATGAYIISSPQGYTKLDGILEVIRRFYVSSREWGDDDDMMNWRDATEHMRKHRSTLQRAHEWLRQFDYVGPFHAYEIVTDLRWTYLLGRATDIYTWCNPGPGCKRGLNRVMRRDKKAREWGSREELLNEMDIILEESTVGYQWVDFAHKMKDKFPKLKTPLEWEMRDVEHTLCEWDKFERTRLGEGRPRGTYR